MTRRALVTGGAGFIGSHVADVLLARGYVVEIHPTTEYPKIKPLSAIEDERVLVPPKLMKLALWMSRYYVSPLGTVLGQTVGNTLEVVVAAVLLPAGRLPEQQSAVLDAQPLPA